MSEKVFIQPDLRPIVKTGGFLGFFKKDLYLLCHDWEYEWNEDGVEYSFFLERGRITDIASVPRIARPLISHDGDLRGAALIHDELYQSKGVPAKGVVWKLENGEWIEYRKKWFRSEADDFFYEIMLESGVSKLVAYTAWIGVRMGGWLPWNKKAKFILSKEEIDKFLAVYDQKDLELKKKRGKSDSIKQSQDA